MSVVEFFMTAQAWASAAAEAEHHAPSINDIWFPLANFLIYAFILVKFAFPLVRDFLRSRRDEVVSTISQASAKKQAAEALVNEYRAKLAGLETEVQSILASLRQEGERERNRVVSEAQATAVKIKEDASFLAEQEVKMARQKLREEMAELAAATARQLVERNLSSADQTRLADDFIQTIGQTR
ncbi:MAG: ATP synthase F0 subunit B [Deltaproteobacteria bacterium]|jgi:F-type H+-transporting ATPase subunit b|nr:MAG: ATP synthase F0 subunit B [Deltaproteobacteria bacterium]